MQNFLNILAMLLKSEIIAIMKIFILLLGKMLKLNITTPLSFMKQLKISLNQRGIKSEDFNLPSAAR